MGRTTTSHIADTLATHPLLRHLLTQYQTLAPLLGYFSKSSVEEGRFYRVDEAGVVERVVFGDKRFTGTNSFSEVLESGGFLYVGSPSSRSALRVKLGGGQ